MAVWKVVGGADKGGLLSRTGRELNSPHTYCRLSTGAMVQELELHGDRLHFLRLTGAGPGSGWVSTRLKDKELMVQADEDAAQKAKAAMLAVGGERWRDILSSRERISLTGDAWYQVLGVAQDASIDEIKKAYRDLSILHHPDKNPMDDDETTFKRVLQAYEDGQAAVGDTSAKRRRAAMRAKLQPWVNGQRETQWVEAIDADELVQLLLADTARAIDVTDKPKNALAAESAEDSPVEFENLSYMTLRLHGEVYEELLENLKEDGKKIVAVSLTGSSRCSEFCGLLIDVFGFDAERVTRLVGGLQGWADWWVSEEGLQKRAVVREAVKNGRCAYF